MIITIPLFSLTSNQYEIIRDKKRVLFFRQTNKLKILINRLINKKINAISNKIDNFSNYNVQTHTV